MGPFILKISTNLDVKFFIIIRIEVNSTIFFFLILILLDFDQTFIY